MLLRLILVALVIVLVFRLFRRIRLPAPLKAADTQSLNPFEALGVSEEATIAQIKTGYHQKLREYHPDKVAHLGVELQQLAQKKTKEIVEAYQQIMRQRTSEP